MSYPSTVSSFTNPSASDKLNSPSHSSIETAQNTGLTELQTFVGTLSSVRGTLIYDVRAAASDGGGHVQSANKGGTGQTSYTKGDILVATSSSVLAKLAVGTDGYAPIADSTAQAGISWQGVLTAPVIQNQTYTYARASVHSNSVYGVVLGSNPSILSDGLGLVVKFPAANATSLLALSVNTQAGSVAALMKKTDLTNFNSGDIAASMIGVLEFDSVSSVFQMVTQLPAATIYKNGVGVISGNPAASIIGYAHGLGKTPKNIRIVSYSDSTNQDNFFTSTGVFNGTTVATAWFQRNASNSQDANTDTTNIVYNIQKASIATINSTQFNLSWSSVVSGVSYDVRFMWEAEG